MLKTFAIRSTLFAAAAMTAACTSTTGPAGPELPIAQAPAAICAQGAAHSRHTVETAGQTIEYDVCAGTLPVLDDNGEVLADLFYTAYFVAEKQDQPRPLSFVWNGGPGADSRLLHLHALGPRIIRGDALVDNPASPLIASDLVFIDPAGTGFSRARSEDAAARLYSTIGDIAATSDFISHFRRRFERSDAPLYLIGESFGTWRAAGVAEALAERDVPVAGIGLISGGIPLGEAEDRSLLRALSLPNRTATALALKRLGPELQAQPERTIEAAEQWARAIWYPALAAPNALSEDVRAAIVADLARFHGLESSQIDRQTLWVSPRDFRNGLLDDEGKILDVFDMRRTSSDDEGEAADAAVIAYYRQELDYGEGSYAGIESEPIPVGASWQYDQAPITKESLARAMAGEGPPSPSQPWTVRAMDKMPAMRVFVAAGIYDSLNSCAANEATVAALPAEIARRFSLHCYAGGHMMYDDPAIGELFGRDLVSFLSKSRI